MAEEEKKPAAKKPAAKKAPAKKAAPKEEVKAEEVKVEEPKTKKPAAKKAPAKKAEPVEEKKIFALPVSHDYEVILVPMITEKTMALLQNGNKITVKVAANANKTEIKESFQRLFQVKVVDVKTANQRAKAKSRGGRYQGTVSGFKKAVITLAEGSAIDLFKE